MKKEDRTLLNEVESYSDRWTILVRVFRRWNMYQKTNPNEISAICMVLIDEEVSENLTGFISIVYVCCVM